MAAPEEDELIHLLALALHQAHIHDPDHPHNGEKWPQLLLSNEEAVHYAKAALNALAGSGLQIGEKNHNAAGQADSRWTVPGSKKLFERVWESDIETIVIIDYQAFAVDGGHNH